jgi:hypothetical protein
MSRNYSILSPIKHEGAVRRGGDIELPESIGEPLVKSGHLAHAAAAVSANPDGEGSAPPSGNEMTPAENGRPSDSAAPAPVGVAPVVPTPTVVPTGSAKQSGKTSGKAAK